MKPILSQSNGRASNFYALEELEKALRYSNYHQSFLIYFKELAEL